MNEKNPRKRGRFTTKSSARPAIEVDCSTWSDVPPSSRVVGRFVTKSSARPAIEVDCSEWAADPAVTLELTLAMEPAANVAEMQLGLSDLLGAVSRLERTLGGTGMHKVSGTQSNGTVILNLAPDEPTGAETRIRQVCDALNQATRLPELVLPAVVKTIAARVV